eukprot:TRINITY_DN15273_c0_g1_i1.p1 TRINITY_DN15273_c0_g1~~TRINITY_DN15273_c0_g1_i1.p1  ORF type:complete len:514 (-),score=119.02 TRINITY_DN15273_c0_g1_i1:98-1639(-)
MASTAFTPPPRSEGQSSATLGFGLAEARTKCLHIKKNLPPMAGSSKYHRSWSIDDALEQHQCLMRQHELQASIGNCHIQVRKVEVEFARQEAQEASSEKSRKAAALELVELQRNLQNLLKRLAIEEEQAAEKMRWMEQEIQKSNAEMVLFREAIDDVANGGGPVVGGNGKISRGDDRKFFYCADCRVGGHGQRFCSYLLKRPNWRVYPNEKWFEDKHGNTSHCPLGRRCIDFTDETYWSRISMHIKGRIWLEDKRKLYEFVPELMPLTYVIVNQQWVGDPPKEEPDAPPMPWFVKETDRNWGTSVVCCAKPSECLGLAKADPDATYVVQKHIPSPLLYKNGEKCHIKFYNLLVGLEDGVTWRMYTYKNGYLSISPKAWSPTDLSKECQVTIIRTKRIDDWEPWGRVYPKCKEGVCEVIRRAAAQGKLEGRDKLQFEIISADYIVTESEDVYLLEFNTGPVLKDPEDSPDVHDAGMVDGALHIVEPWEGGTEDLWELALECKGIPPKFEDANQP